MPRVMMLWPLRSVSCLKVMGGKGTASGGKLGTIALQMPSLIEGRCHRASKKWHLLYVRGDSSHDGRVENAACWMT